MDKKVNSMDDLVSQPASVPQWQIEWIRRATDKQLYELLRDYDRKMLELENLKCLNSPEYAEEQGLLEASKGDWKRVVYWAIRWINIRNL